MIDLDALEQEYEGYEADGFPDIGDNRVLGLVAELRAARKVVEALTRPRREGLPGIWYWEHSDFNSEDGYQTYEDVRTALVELEALK